MSKFWLFGFFTWPLAWHVAGSIKPTWLGVIILGVSFFLMCMGGRVFWRIENKVKSPRDRQMDILREKNKVFDELMLRVYRVSNKMEK